MWRGHWQTITQRLNHLVQGARFLLETSGTVGSDYFGVSNSYLIPGAIQVVDDIRVFNDTHGAILPEKARTCVETFLNNMQRDFFRPGSSRPSGWPGVQGLFPPLMAFSSEFEFHMSDVGQIAKSLTERAFLHLQRSIVADADVASKWQKAFKKGEVACEKLGAVHLLSHGIWPFKVDGAGERTDLVLSQKINSETVQKTDTMLVLTEWKVAKPNEVTGRCENAMGQAKRYSQGVLAGVELTSTRYIVIVTEKHEEMPANTNLSNVTFAFVNIAVKPLSPSRS